MAKRIRIIDPSAMTHYDHLPSKVLTCDIFNISKIKEFLLLFVIWNIIHSYISSGVSISPNFKDNQNIYVRCLSPS
jgi:hypothetical protein